MSVRTQLLGLTLLSALAGPIHALAAPSYAMTFLPPNVSQAVGIDNQGRIAVTYTEPFYAHAGLWSANGTITDLGDLGGGISVAFGISTNGYVSGYSEIAMPTYAPHAFVYAHGTMTDLGTLGGLRSVAFAVNASGQAVGESGTLNGAHAFRYSKGVMHDLGTLGGNHSQATAINNRGVVVGWSTLAAPPPLLIHAFRYARGSIVDLGTLEGGTYSSAQAINDAGLIAGVGNGTGFEDSTHAFLYEDGVMTDIGTLGGRVLVHDINNRGQVVGRSGDIGFLYTDGRMVDLNSLIDCTLGWHIWDAIGINNAQQIVAAVTNAEGAFRVVRLDRVPGASDDLR
jgi:probable HAF family extracellular repeat protein